MGYNLIFFSRIHATESQKIIWSFLFFFSILCGYFVLRPVRDEMGIINGAENMQWLFTATFVAMLLLVPVFGFWTQKCRIFTILSWSVALFIIILIFFLLLFRYFGKTPFLATSFFVWLSVYNLFIVSLFWSFMSDIFSSNQSKRVFGIIAAGGSTGALAGPLVASVLANYFDIGAMLLTAAIILSLAFISLRRLLILNGSVKFAVDRQTTPTNRIIGAGVFNNVKKTFGSRYLFGIVIFILLYTAISTLLYFQQAHIVERELIESTERLLYFSRVDFMTNSLALFGQFVLTRRITLKYGLPITLCSVPIIVSFGFFVLSLQISLTVLAVVIIVHRAGNFALLKPGREILYTVGSRDEKYQAKNFIDTAVYRGGDALTGWLFATLLSLGLGLSGIAVLSVFLAILWGITGFSLGHRHQNKESIPKEIKKKDR